MSAAPKPVDPAAGAPRPVVRSRDPELSGLVLCGGRSTRMGRDKAVLELGGTTLLARAVGVLDEIAAPVLIACGPEQRYAELGRPLVLDAIADGGPLAGLCAGLAALDTPWLAVLACDLPGAQAEIFAALLARARRADLDACLLGTPERPEPLLGVYRRTCRGPAERALAAGERRAIAFHRGHGALAPLAIGFVDPRGLPIGGRAWTRNVNTPADLEAAR